MTPRLALCAIVLAAIAAGAAGIALPQNGPGRPHWQGHGIKPPGRNFPLPEIVSGYWFRTKETEAIQDDDFNNPGFFAVEQGEQLWSKPDGAAGKSCASCHERNYGRNLRADFLSQGQSNGFPVYRLRDQRLVPLHERMEGCIFDVRGIPYAPLSDEFLALELYVAWRGTGLPVETPAVRN